MEYKYLIDLALILFFTKALGIATKKIHMPQIVGAMIAGLLLGPCCFNLVQKSDFISCISELGVIGIMFGAGLGVDIKKVMKTFGSSFVIALLGVLVPIGFGTLAVTLYDGGYSLQAVFIGIIFTATSVAISVSTLTEIGHLSSNTGNAILSAAIIDDVLGVIALAAGMSLTDSSISVMETIFNVIVFFVMAFIVGFIVSFLFDKYVALFKGDKKRFTTFAFAFALVMAFVAETYFRISAIVGAFVAGVVLSHNRESSYIATKFEVVQYLIFNPVFFASIGLQVSIDGFGWSTLLLTLIFIVVAVASKVVGCGLGAKICKYSWKDSLKIGVGMVGRGEVVLILANIALDKGIITQNSFAAIIITVIFCAVSTPLVIKMLYKDEKPVDFCEIK